MEQVGTPDTPSDAVLAVVVATQNRADLCTRLLKTLAEQSLDHSRFEVVVVDDCSDDDTPEALASLARQLPYRLRTLRTEVSRGAGPARNLGWQSCTAEFIAFTDDDCLPQPTWLE